MINKLHASQVVILSTLRHATRARYSELMRPTGLDGDIFKYHLQKLVRQKYIGKADDGMYELTAEGKEFANRLDEKTGREIAQPKVSMLLIVRSRQDSTVRYLAHCRTREPFRGFWGIASAPMLRGMPIRDSAASELKKQTGISATFSVVGGYRVIDKTPGGKILEDKLFSIMLADVDNCPDPHYWYGGKSVWLTKHELLQKTRLFPTTKKTIEMVEQHLLFAEETCVYNRDEY